MSNNVICLRSDAQCPETVNPRMRVVWLNECQRTCHFARWFWVLAAALMLLISGCASKPIAPVIDRDPLALPDVKQPTSSLPDSMTLVKERLESFARVWEGVRYRLGGNDETGIDCSALSARIYQDLFSKSLPRTTSAQLKIGQSVRRHELRPGDLVFFKLPGGDRHVGVFVGDDRFLHASQSRGVMTSSLASDFWRRHYFQATRPQTSGTPSR